MNYGIVLSSDKTLSVQDLPDVREPSFEEVKLRTLYCGLCGSDLHLLKHGEIASYKLEDDLVIGHEVVAQVISVGPEVDGFKEGDLVTCEPALSCMGCFQCLSGKNNLCNSAFDRLCGMPDTDGFLRHQFIHPTIFCHKLPETLSNPMKGSLCEPLAVVIHSVKRSKLQPGMDVLIVGAGSIGLLTLLVARHWGARNIIVVDKNPSRLAIASQLGADGTIQNTEDNLIELEFKLKICSHNAQGVDRTFECTGSQDGTKLAIGCTRTGGKVIATGLGPPQINVPMTNASMKEIDIIGVCRYKIDCFPLAVSLLDVLNLDPILGNVYPYTDISRAFEALEMGEGIKITIDMTTSDNNNGLSHPVDDEAAKSSDE